MSVRGDSDYDFMLVLDKYVSTDIEKLRKIVRSKEFLDEDLNLNFLYLTDIKFRGKANFQIRSLSLPFYIYLAGAKLLEGRNIFNEDPIRLRKDSLAKMEGFKIQEYYGRCDKLYFQKITDDEAFAKQWGELPMIYGQQWRRWPAKNGRTIDQIAWIVDTLKNFPDRKHAVLSVWNPEYLYSMALPGEALSFPLCHILIHFNVAGNRLSVQLYQRSADTFLGVPFNIASYALLLHMVAQVTGTVADECVLTLNDAHIYHEHFDAVNEQLAREPMALPQLWLNPEVRDIDSFTMDDIKLENYQSHPAIKAKMIV